MLIVEYQNWITKDGKPVGHGKKVFNESISLVEQYNPVGMACQAYVDKKNNNVINRSLCDDNRGKFELYRVQIKNILNAFKYAKKHKEEYIWFTNVNWILLACVSLFKPKAKIIVTLFRDIVKDQQSKGTKLKGIKDKLVRQGLERASLVVVTNPSLKIAENQIHIPDFYYSDLYKKYEQQEKKNQIACLGIIRNSKDIIGLVDHFRDTDVKVYISGKFMDEEVYQHAVHNCGKNIIINNRNLSDPEYYSLLAESKYVILPYKEELCKDATSGILLETIFLGNIPIAPSILLEHNEINGISYRSLEDLPKTMAEIVETGKGIVNNIERYRKENVMKRLTEAINKTRTIA